MTYFSPTGARIKGTLERLEGIALINGIGADGEPEYSGETEVNWNTQSTVIRDDEMVFVDTNGEEWPLSQLKTEEAA